MNTYERQQVNEAARRPTAARPRTPAKNNLDEAKHAEREGEYEKYLVTQAIKAATRNHDEGVK